MANGSGVGVKVRLQSTCILTMPGLCCKMSDRLTVPEETGFHKLDLTSLSG